MARHLPTYVGMTHRAEQTLSDSLRQVGEGHPDDGEVGVVAEVLAAFHDEHVRRLGPIAERYGEEHVDEPERLHADGLSQTRKGPVGLLRDLQDLYLLASLVETSWMVLVQAAQGARDKELQEVGEQALTDAGRTLQWLTTQIKVSAPQALLASLIHRGQ